MVANPPRLKSVLETILDWSESRPLWLRDALRRIVAKGRLTDNDIEELVSLCKQGKSNTDTSLIASPFANEHLPSNPASAHSVSLLSISDVEGVNKLAPNQTLSFIPSGITVIYGDNGTGKSGYTRILKRACRARHSGKIEPDVYSETPIGPAKATIHYAIGDTPSPVERWEDSTTPHPILSAVSVFDTECASVHINGENEVAFRPFGLDIPDELAGVCQKVSSELTAEQTQLKTDRNAVFLAPSWTNTTSVGTILSSLQSNSDLQQIKSLAVLSEDESTRLAQLTADLAKDPTKASAEHRLKADNIKKLVESLETIEEYATESKLQSLFTLHLDSKTKSEAARLAAEKVFASELLEGVASPIWKILWESARRYSTEIAYPDQAFPPKTSEFLCVLCQQPLQAEALERMNRFEEFIQQDTEHQAHLAQTRFKEAYQKTLSKEVKITPFISTCLQELDIINLDLSKAVRRFLAGVRLKRYYVIKHLDAPSLGSLPEMPRSPIAQLQQLERSLRQYVQELQNSDTADSRKALQTEFLELKDRKLLKDLLPIIEKEVERLKNIDLLEACIAETSTRSITLLGNTIADTVITPKLRDRFQEEIVKLAADKVRVEIVRSGGKYGSPQYQVRLFAKPDAKIKNILSEGERTCVALAAFLTEVATASHHSAFVFDDPVSSLDHRWRSKVAKRLVEESQNRQVIVFTHDLVFVNDINDLAVQKEQAIELHTTNRGSIGSGVITPGLPWKAQKVEDRIDKLEKDARKAQALFNDDQENEYTDEAIKIYDRLRATWERALEDIAFSRVIQRHRDYIDTKNLKKLTAFNEADCAAFRKGFQRCCDIVDAHDPSRGRNATPPTPDEILLDLESLKQWVKDLRERQKPLNT